MNFNLASPKAISAFINTVKNIGHIQSRLANTTVTGKAQNIALEMTCGHAVVGITLQPEFNTMPLADQARVIMEALSYAKAKVDQEIRDIAGPLATMMVNQANKRT